MHITQLRIAGFKSFVDPQDLLIEPGLTGIVGPNGCGKSNLLEALRWAMGASSARAMRGGEMDDLIFSGAEGRPARESAEVTLVIDNTKRQAPAEFNASDTLEVLRKLKRGSGSTYKLNGRTVRGKDIQLLFADASTGANSPALVRQGQISELIGSKPQNRRRILEEAAGISGLNTRRHEAELKLRGAETNLERLSEVSAEVERQLESLKRQARKARKYRALSDEIAALEAYVAHMKWEHAEAQVRAARDTLDATKADVERTTRDAAIAETERLKASEGIEPLRQTLGIAGAKLGQSRIELAKLETERDTAQDAFLRLEKELGRLSEDLERETATRAEAEAAAAQSRDALAALPTEDASQAEAQEALAREALSAAQEKLAAAQTKADLAQSQLAEAKARQEAARANVEAAEKRRDQLDRQLHQYENELNALPAPAVLAETLSVAQLREAEAKAALDAADDDVDAAEATLAGARTAEQDSEPARADAEQTLRTLEAEINGLKRLLRKAEGPKAPPVVERMRTEPGYEKAVAAALGDDLQAPTDTAAALYWAGAKAVSQSLPGGVQPLTAYVDAPGELAARLSQCGLASPEDGPRLVSELAPGQRLVSTEGHLWRWDGFTRTPDAPVSAAERLEQQARLEAAEAEHPAMRAAAEKTRAAHTDARENCAVAEAALKTARSNLAPLAQSLSDTRRALAAAEQAMERASLKRETATANLARAQAERQTADQAVRDATPTGGSITDLSGLQDALELARSELSSAREAETEARGRLTDLTRNRDEARKRRAGFERDVATWLERINAADARLARLAERRRTALQEAQSARQRPEALAVDIHGLQARVDQLEEQRKTAADALAEKERAQRDADSHARETANAAAKTRENLATTKVRLETAEGKLDELVVLAREAFERTPQGLLTLAKPGLDDEVLDALDQREAEQRAMLLRRDRDALGGVNQNAETEAEELAERLGGQAIEKEDLTGAIAKLREGVDKLNAEGRERLIRAFDAVNEHFKALFTALFQGGQAELRLVDADDPLNAGLEIMAQPPGKKLGTLALMSGGEQALTAAALIFAVFLSRPAPICVLDEVDAPLDDANVDRFCRMLDEMRSRTDTRFVVITHNPVTMSRMDRLFGVTMREKGVSKLVSVDLGAAEELVAAE
ncbi:MAG: AAA family ATPase [Pseudomonadota bacterium]